MEALTQKNVANIGYSKAAVFRKGCMAGFPIAIGYIPIAITFGVIASAQGGLTLWEATFMSLWVYAGASQYISIQLLHAGSSTVEIILATFILNLRHFLMSTTLSHFLRPSRKTGALLSFGITDETFVVATTTEGSNAELSTFGDSSSNDAIANGAFFRSPLFFGGIALVSYSSWVLGTAAGILFSNLIPASLQSSMGISLYALFIGLLVPSVRKSVRTAIIAFISAGLAWMLSQWLAMGWSIVLATIIASTIGFIGNRLQPNSERGESL